MGVETSESVEDPDISPQVWYSSSPIGERTVVGYAGTLGHSNSLTTLMKCVADLALNDQIHFVILGDGDLRDELVSSHGHLPNITFIPKVAKNQVQHYLRQFDLLYFGVKKSPRWQYGQSLNKIVDYMMAGKPIIASYSGFPSMINEAHCGTFVPAEDPVALRLEIERFSAMPPAVRAEIGSKGRNWLLRNRSYEKLAKDYLQILFPTETTLEK
jgi:glycosyltransferase involved in cell wall biosynthesis